MRKPSIYLCGLWIKTTGKKEHLSFQNKTNPSRTKDNVTKHGQILKTINVRRKSKYFNGKHRLIF